MQISYDVEIPLPGRGHVPATAVIGSIFGTSPGLISITLHGSTGITRVNKGTKFRRAELYLTNTREIWQDICDQIETARIEFDRKTRLMQLLRRALITGEHAGEPLSDDEFDRAKAAYETTLAQIEIMSRAA